ncbi:MULTISPECIES: ATP-dependent zinc metalloprotease FtsH [Pelosinus]|uniref:ATP-dependent zinc metalloprotease FtsH n=1 Tax=Pelosinus fermentans B4 TaxID=1149862 RepID=I8RIE8_9FIRM|nr:MULTISPECIES: ATP-dependent zinc metalloprotease FtsH [Pelosinus]EIW19643.1 ATP-dependent metalloprotease FtsH [Pelosinus fermentans B4]EIW24614.1 ATP-dependent metalloprotease FtsH [Pelosinus fermentans A11]OAM95921.1 peptidase M41 FtsH domain protein [Pelosinus fermentans DSM 17108]SDR34375.1 cell division protease FtsH [Pelosinus fermentans]
MNKFFRNVSFYLLIIIIAISIIDYYSSRTTNKQEISYTQFLHQIEEQKVQSVTVVDKDIRGKLTDGTEFTTITPNDPTLINTLREKNVDIKAEQPPQPPWWTTIFSSILPMLLLIGVWFFIMQQTQGGGNRVMSFGKSRAKLHGEDKIKVTFGDMAGADEAKQELEEVVEFLKHPKKFNDLGARIPKGVLLFGPPGTGKTLLARAVAGEAGVPFFSISGSDFVEMFVGVGASRVRDLFEQAKKSAPCIVFIDEIDAVGRQRGAGLGGGHDEREQTLNQLLVEMDGFGVNEGIIIIAATNRPDILDPALLRPGRFDRQIVVDKPDVKGRLEILKVHTKGKPVAKEVSLDVLARRTPGFTGADLSNLVNEAALLAARRNKKRIDMPEMEESVERVVAGPERKSKVISEREKKLTAYHEAGHALIGMLLDNTDPVHKVSIIPRGRAGGYTLMLPTEDRYYATRTELLEQLSVLLGGRVAEAVVLKEISTGAQNDLERATDLSRKMITEYGMSENLGPITFGNRQQQQVFLGRDISRDRNYGEEVASSIDKEVRRLIEGAYNKTEAMLQENIEKLHLIAAALIEKETLEASDLEELLAHGQISQKSGTEKIALTKTESVEDTSDTSSQAGPKIVYITRS